MSFISMKTGDWISFSKDGKQRKGMVVRIEQDVVHLVVKKKKSFVQMLVKAEELNGCVYLGKTKVPKIPGLPPEPVHEHKVVDLGWQTEIRPDNLISGQAGRIGRVAGLLNDLGFHVVRMGADTPNSEYMVLTNGRRRIMLETCFNKAQGAWFGATELP